MKQFGLIGKKLTHSFSKKYFTEKFKKEEIEDCQYDLFEIPEIAALPKLIQETAGLQGINVTIPYKNEVLPFMDRLDQSAKKIGAVNVVRILENGQLEGYNSDYYGFKNSLEKWLGDQQSEIKTALVLGTGGASKAVRVALEDLSITVKMVSRSAENADHTYTEIAENPQILKQCKLVVNTTPLGTFPNEAEKPDLPYEEITDQHFLYDLVYNPEITAFMQEGLRKGAKAKNGYEMLVLQAEKSWEIWQAEKTGEEA
ncbi:shikimate dehydrogenase [Persicobacter diffluens]|uniref:Shikimate 5-dehydrogenase n=1 Tax=Persicobacter diffluens TaxID=981 RepID=A0AAN4W028_9BACT|nr:shikimate 5-dehydrogenase [Persicobacter diffluens]